MPVLRPGLDSARERRQAPSMAAGAERARRKEQEEAMTDETLPRPGRRALLMGTAGAATTLAMPAISYGQSDAIRIGHLTPRTGFLGPLGEYAVQAVQLAAEEVNAAGGVLGRRVELLIE